MMMKIFYALVTLCVTSSTLAQKFGWGPCPDMNSMPNFDLSKMEGRWYEVRRYFTLTEFTAKCITTDFRRGENGTMLMNSSAISSFNGREYLSPNIVIRSPYQTEPGMLKIKAPGVPFAIPAYLVLGTDYNSYMVGYTCINIELFHFQLVWIGAREKQPANPIVNKAIRLMRQHKLNVKRLMKTDQRDCEVEDYDREIEDLS